jgi:hypothetical protein
MSDLLPCPFCGAALWLHSQGHGQPDLWLHPRQSACVLSHFSLPLHMIAAWNTRAPAPPPADGGDT